MFRTFMFLGLIGLVSSPVRAQVLLDQFGAFGPAATSQTQHCELTVTDAAKVLVLETTVVLTQGKGTVRITDPHGKAVFDASTGGSMRIKGQVLRTAGVTGVYRVEVIPQQAIGSWLVRIAAGDVGSRTELLFIPAAGMLAVAAAACWMWRRRSGAPWRWFWVGAAIWFVGVLLKFVWAVPLNRPILSAFSSLLPHAAYLVAGSIYIGLLTGVFEIGITLLAALYWKRMTRDAARGIAVGVGAGAFEAALLGAAMGFAVLAALVSRGAVRDQLLATLGTSAKIAPHLLLVGPVERVLAVLCHTSSRALVLWGVARGRWFWPFVAGFSLLTAIDSVAGYAHLSGQLGRISVWWIELAIAPAAIVSIPIVVYCSRNWPAAELPADTEKE